VLYYKHLMVLEGNQEYALNLNPADQLSPSQKRYAAQQLTLFKTWYSEWSVQIARQR
jgi:4-hydroxy-tetrahydrodipicolinate synthase